MRSPVASARFAGLVAFALVAVFEPSYAQGTVAGAPPQGLDAGQLVDELGCAACHAGVASTTGTVRARTPSFVGVGAEYEPEHVFWYLQDPVRIRRDIGATRMPSFGLSERESLALTLYIRTLRDPSSSAPNEPNALRQHFENNTRRERRDLRRTFSRVRREHNDITVEAGASLFRAFNCAGCHEAGDVQPVVIGPDLSSVGRLKEEWLHEYLAEPAPIRPFGFYPGSGARMPNFALTANEVRALAVHLRSQRTQPAQAFVAQSLTPFARDKALRLVRDRLPCLGCHRLNGEGGRIGPDLSNVGGRLSAASVRDMLTSPQRLVPGSVMPHHPMPDDRIDLISSFLVSQTADAGETYASPLDFASVQPSAGNTGAQLYERFCSSCHGITGGGDGFNASFLPTKPTAHADSTHMSSRPDDTLFDAIHAGGYILGKSHRMPAFGSRLTSDEIRTLVSYMRELCRCVGPSWSRDDGGT